MNEKKCKRMRKFARGVTGAYASMPFEAVYKSLKKGVRNEAKLARFMATTNQPVERPKAVIKEQDNDTNN